MDDGAARVSNHRMSKRHAWAVALAVVALVGCSSSSADDGVATNDANEINEGRGALERELDPPVAAPASTVIGAKMTDVLTAAKGTATAGAAVKLGEDCTSTPYKDGKTKKVVVFDVQCKSSAVVRVMDTDGETVKAEHTDLNKDGKVDRWTGADKAIVQLTDTNFDGKLDVVVEKVELLKDFSLEGYDEAFPKDRFLYRVREDRNRDGKLDYEKLIARGALPAKQS